MFFMEALMPGQHCTHCEELIKALSVVSTRHRYAEEMLESALNDGFRKEKSVPVLRHLVGVCARERKEAVERYSEHTLVHHEIATASGAGWL